MEEFVISLSDARARFVKVKAANLGVCPDRHNLAGDQCWLFVNEVVVE